MNILSTDKAPGAIGPYSQGYEVNGLFIRQDRFRWIRQTEPWQRESLPRLSRAVRMWEQSWSSRHRI